MFADCVFLSVAAGNSFKPLPEEGLKDGENGAVRDPNNPAHAAAGSAAAAAAGKDDGVAVDTAASAAAAPAEESASPNKSKSSIFSSNKDKKSDKSPAMAPSKSNSQGIDCKFRTHFSLCFTSCQVRDPDKGATPDKRSL